MGGSSVVPLAGMCQFWEWTERQIVLSFNILVARPKRFGLLTPRFVVWFEPLISLWAL